MPSIRLRRAFGAARLARNALGALLLGVLASACRVAPWPPPNITNEQLFAASLAQLRQHNWNNAVSGFDRLTLELPSHDPLMPLSLYYLGQAHEGRDEHLLAAQSFARVTEGFAGDTLADDALFAAGKSYASLWRKPDLDPEYGETALNTFRTLLALYPDSPLRPDVEREIARLNDWFATKNYDIAMHYFRRHAWYSAIIYLKDILQQYPGTPTAREAQIRLADAYGQIHYADEHRETCAALWQKYPGDGEVRDICGPPPHTAAAPAPPPPPAGPPSAA